MKFLKSIAILSLFIVSTGCLAQNEPIEFYKGDFGMVFTQNGKILKPRDLVSITEGQIQADIYMKKAKLNSDWASVFGVIGGALVGWPVGTALAGGDPNWVLAGAGAGFIAISIPFAIGYKKNAIRGANIHNQNISTDSRMVHTYQLTAGSNGLGITFSF